MLNRLYFLSLTLFSLLFNACGGTTTTDNGATTGALSISGQIQYERVHPHAASSIGLDYSNISNEVAKQVIVKAVNGNEVEIASTSTDDQGKYTLNNLPENSNLKIRVYAKMFQSSAWDVKVIDNTNGDAQYVMEGSMVNSGTSNSVRNLRATASDKSSPPFAILGSIYQAMSKVKETDSSVVFPKLQMNWSVNNIEKGTYYDGALNIVLLGDQKGDSDEYDHHVVIHEWGHFFESKLSRADNIGGGHGASDHLDIRVAFGEGFGNALSGMVTDDPIYFDTTQGAGWSMNLESSSKQTPGWFSEASIQRILYDLYDANNDDADNLALGFTPIYNVLTNGQKNTPAFTSIFSFITELKKEQSGDVNEIDSIISNEQIAVISDSYGTNRTNTPTTLYQDYTLGTSVTVCTKNTYGNSPFPNNNKLNHHRYIKFNINNSNNHEIKVKQNNGTNADPDFVLFKTSAFEKIAESNGRGTEEKSSLTLESGDYLLDISDANNISEACFSLSIN